MTNITLKRGDTFNRPIFLNIGGVGVDITGYTFYFTVKRFKDNVLDDLTALIKKDITIFTEPLNGKFLLELSPTDTDIPQGEYFYDLQYKNASGDIKTIVENPLFIVDGDVTRRN